MTTDARKGGALLAVMWVSAALGVIAFSVAGAVQGETERTSTSVDDLRAYYLATGGIERAMLHMQWGQNYFLPGQPGFTFQFPAGEVTVQVIPEAAKLNVNQIQPPQLYALLLALGQDEEHAQAITAAIVDWRTPASPNGDSPFDGYYASLVPSFRAPHASIQEIEELQSVRGMTPDLFYGTYVHDASVSPPQLVERGGLRDCLSPFGTSGPVDVNYAPPAVLAGAGLPMDAVQALVGQRPFRTQGEWAAFSAGNPGFARLRLGGNSVYTLRATARPRNADGKLAELRRTVSATVKIRPGYDPPTIILRWYDRG